MIPSPFSLGHIHLEVPPKQPKVFDYLQSSGPQPKRDTDQTYWDYPVSAGVCSIYTSCIYLMISRHVVLTSYHTYNISRISYQRYNHYNPHNRHNHNVHIYISVVYALVCVFVVFIYGAGSFCLLLWHLLTLGGPMFSRCCHISEIVTYLSVRVFVLLISIVWMVYLLLWHLLTLGGLLFADAVAHLMLYACICLL